MQIMSVKHNTPTMRGLPPVLLAGHLLLSALLKARKREAQVSP